MHGEAVVRRRSEGVGERAGHCEHRKCPIMLSKLRLRIEDEAQSYVCHPTSTSAAKGSIQFADRS